MSATFWILIMLSVTSSLTSAVDPGSACSTQTPTSKMGDLKSLKVQYEPAFVERADLALLKSGGANLQYFFYNLGFNDLQLNFTYT